MCSQIAPLIGNTSEAERFPKGVVGRGADGGHEAENANIDQVVQRHAVVPPPGCDLVDEGERGAGSRERGAGSGEYGVRSTEVGVPSNRTWTTHQVHGGTECQVSGSRCQEEKGRCLG